jgi:DNA-binding PadR family transcriptional regulator
MTMETDETLDGLRQELRRGVISVAVLSLLSKPQYGYSLVSILEQKGLAVEPGTLYPLLRRLEKQGLLESQWDVNQARPRKYYLLSATGRETYDQLCQDWRSMASGLDELIGASNDQPAKPMD